MIQQEFVPDPVQLVGGHPGDNGPAYLLQRLGGKLPGDAHPLDGFRVLHVRLAEPRVAAAHVFRGRDRRGDLAERRNPAGLEQRCHDLKV